MLLATKYDNDKIIARILPMSKTFYKGIIFEIGLNKEPD